MAFSQHQGPRIVGISNVIATHIEDNLTLSYMKQDESEAFVKHTGIRYRRVASKELNILDFFEQGINQIIAKTKWDLDSINVLICVTQSPNHIIPSVSNRIHGNLRFTAHTLCFDIVSGCSGLIYGLNVVFGILKSLHKEKSRAILCCGDLSTQLIDSTDASVHPIFSDGISTLAIENNHKQANEISYFNLETFGSAQHAIAMDDKSHKMKLNGIDVFTNSLKWVPQNIDNLLQFAKKNSDFPDAFVFHQANQLINESIRKKMNIHSEKFPSSINQFGNTASASIPITLASCNQQIKRQSNYMLLAGFGVGFSVASTLLHFEPEFCENTFEL